jgi:hypothetical protein
MGRTGAGRAAVMELRALVLAAATFATACGLAGCSSMLSVKMMNGQPGADLSAVRVGATRADVEARLGAPVRTWTTREGVEYWLYRYDGGVPPDPSAAFLVLIDVLTLGLPTALDQAMPETSAEREQRMRWVAVSYDREGVVLGVFVDIGDFTALPADGRSPPRGENSRPTSNSTR